MVLHLLDSLDQRAETTASGTEGVVALVALGELQVYSLVFFVFTFHIEIPGYRTSLGPQSSSS